MLYNYGWELLEGEGVGALVKPSCRARGPARAVKTCGQLGNQPTVRESAGPISAPLIDYEKDSITLSKSTS